MQASDPSTQQAEADNLGKSKRSTSVSETLIRGEGRYSGTSEAGSLIMAGAFTLSTPHKAALENSC